MNEINADSISLKIDDVAFGGDGVGRAGGQVVFVPFVADGEEVAVNVVSRHARFSRAALQTVRTASPHRAPPPCRWFGACGGCQYQHIEYAHQLRLKHKQLADLMRRLGKMDGPEPEPMVASPEPFGYRNKITLHGGGERPGFLGLDNQTILPVDACPLALPAINACLGDLLAGRPLQRGEHVIIRANRRGRIYSHWMFRTPDRDRRRAPGRTEESEWMEEQVAGRSIKFPVASFFQANIGVVERIIARLQAEIPAGRFDLLVDAYCGCGFFSLFLADRVARVAGVESDSASIRAARVNAREAGLTNAEFVVHRAEKPLRHWLSGVAAARACVLLDPPRAGCAPELLAVLSDLKPGRILYLSCNPPMLVRDLHRLCAAGYVLKSITPFDMFPQTAHFEVLAVLDSGV